MSEEIDPAEIEDDDDPATPAPHVLAPHTGSPLPGQSGAEAEKPRRGRPPSAKVEGKPGAVSADPRPQDNKVVKLLDKNPLGMTLPEMAGGPRQIKRIKTMRPQLAEAIRSGLVMPVSQRAGHTVYRLVKHIANR